MSKKSKFPYVKETVEKTTEMKPIFELSKGTLRRYIKAAEKDAADTQKKSEKALKITGRSTNADVVRSAQKTANKYANKSAKRSIGAIKARYKVSEDIDIEESAIADPKLAAQVAARKAQREKNAKRLQSVQTKKKESEAKPKQQRAPRKNVSDIRDAADRHIVMQLRKAQDVGGNHEIEFLRGS